MLKKSLALFAASVFAVNANAAVNYPGYLEVQGLYTMVPYKLSYLTNGVTARAVDRNGINFHVDLGYQFTEAFAAELGVLWTHWPIYRAVLGQNIKVKHNVVYLAGKYGFSLGKRWQIYGKGGISYVARRGFSVANIQMLSSKLMVTPIFGAGLLFKINPHWSLDASWMQALPQSHQKLPVANFFGFGGIYQFAF
jgi:opacity protein-like surface antigen